MRSHCGFANGLGMLRGNSNSFLSGANFAWRLRPLALNSSSWHAAGARSGALTTHSARVLANRAWPQSQLLHGPTLVRRAQLGISSWVQVPGEQGLTSHSYRVLQLKG